MTEYLFSAMKMKLASIVNSPRTLRLILKPIETGEIIHN